MMTHQPTRVHNGSIYKWIFIRNLLIFLLFITLGFYLAQYYRSVSVTLNCSLDLCPLDCVCGERVSIYKVENSKQIAEIEEIIKKKDVIGPSGAIYELIFNLELPLETKGVIEDKVFSCRLKKGKKLIVVFAKTGTWIKLVDLSRNFEMSFTEANQYY